MLAETTAHSCARPRSSPSRTAPTSSAPSTPAYVAPFPNHEPCAATDVVIHTLAPPPIAPRCSPRSTRPPPARALRSVPPGPPFAPYGRLNPSMHPLRSPYHPTGHRSVDRLALCAPGVDQHAAQPGRPRQDEHPHHRRHHQADLARLRRASRGRGRRASVRVPCEPPLHRPPRPVFFLMSAWPAVAVPTRAAACSSSTRRASFARSPSTTSPSAAPSTRPCVLSRPSSIPTRTAKVRFPHRTPRPLSVHALIRSPAACFVRIQSARRAGSQDRPRYASWSAAHTRPTMLTALPMFSLSPHADQARPARKAVVLQDDQGRVLDGLRSQACSSKRPAHPPRYTCFCLYTLRIQKKQ